MASETLKKQPCAVCDKVAGLFTCRGCHKDFCKRHVAEHQQELSQKLDELTLIHDQFRQSLTEQTTESHQHPLMKQIDRWEKKSINKIRHAADEARTILQNKINQHMTKLTEAVITIAQELRKARDDDDFFEKDLQQWMENLNKLKKDLAQPLNIDIPQEDNIVIPLILNNVERVLSKEIFGQSIGDVRIEDEGRVIVKSQAHGYATVRSNGEYSIGQHRFRFKYEEYHPWKWLLIGIISKNVPMQAISHKSPSSYGWAGFNVVFLNGVLKHGVNGYNSDIEQNDIVELFVDCDQRIIRLTNERTRSVFELKIDTTNCPFPWQLNFNTYCSNDRVRILQI